MDDGPLFPTLALPAGLVDGLRRLNPWWEGKPGVLLPATRRHLVAQMRRRLDARLAPIVVVRGPRQIGKTTAQLQLIADLLGEGVPPRNILRFQADELDAVEQLEDPVAAIVGWFERAVLNSTLNETAHRGLPTYLFFDEVQNLRNWAAQLKFLVDASTTQVVLTGSSALRIELGRDSLAGRISTIEAGPLSLTEIGLFGGIDVGRPFLRDNGLGVLTDRRFWTELAAHGRGLGTARDEVFRRFSERGGYPLAHRAFAVPWEQVADQLNETVIRRVIQHDLRVGDRGRKRDATLLEELFRLCCRYAGQTPAIHLFIEETRRALAGNVGDGRVRSYLRFLHDTLLVRLVQPLEIRLKRRRSGPKICLADHALRASWLQESIPLTPDALSNAPDLAAQAGHIAESVAGACLCTVSGLDVNHVPARDHAPEVDFVLTVGTRRIPIEVKYQRRIRADDAAGLLSFVATRANGAEFGVLITQSDDDGLSDPRVVTLPLSTFLLLR